MSLKSRSAGLPRRFYGEAAAGPVDAGFGVLLDGKPVRTPEGKRLVLPNAALASLLAQEWQTQAEHIAIPDMPATRLAFTVVDRTIAVHAALADEVANWAGSDALCYFAPGPDTLVERELLHWGPVLDWAHEALGLEFVRVTGVIHQPQPPATLERARALALPLDDFSLAGLAMAAGLFGSAVLAFALQRGQLDGQGALDISRVDEAFQEEQWGIDAEAAERTARMTREAAMLECWFRALDPL
jgi:chaperone required for assembly of F1-ATPase